MSLQGYCYEAHCQSINSLAYAISAGLLLDQMRSDTQTDHALADSPNSIARRQPLPNGNGFLDMPETQVLPQPARLAQATFQH